MFPTVNYAFCSDSPGIQIMIYYDCDGLLASAVKQYMTRKIFLLFFAGLVCVKARANARNIVGQQDATLLGPTCCERLHTMLCVVACCWKLLDEV